MSDIAGRMMLISILDAVSHQTFGWLFYKRATKKATDRSPSTLTKTAGARLSWMCICKDGAGTENIRAFILTVQASLPYKNLQFT